MARHRKLVVDELLTKPSAVAPMLFVGIGGCGCRMVARVAHHLARRPDYQERYKSLVKFALIDTNINDLEAYREISDENFLISDFEKEEYANLAAGKLFLEADPYFTQWVPPDYRFRAGDTAGAGQIRIESRLGIFYQMKHKDFIPRMRRLLEDLKSHEHGHRRLDSPEIRIVLCYSVAGGTGSGCHLPLAYVLRDLAQELGKPRLLGVAVLPAVFEDKTGINRDGTFANGYAALKETEHLMKLGAPDSRFYPDNGITFHYNPQDTSRTRVRQRPFEFLYVVDKPQSFTVEDPVAAAADGLYLQFFSPLYGVQASDYDNYTQHQRFLVPHDFEGKGILGFTTFYGSYGSAVLLVPGDGLVDYCSQAAALGLMQESFLRDIPGDSIYQSLRINREPFEQVTLGNADNEKPIHRSEFYKKEPADRDTLRDRLFAKRVRLLAACEHDAEVNGRFTSLFRHGHRPGTRPTREGGWEFQQDQVKPDHSRLVEGGMEYSIGALVLESLCGRKQGELPGLLREAREAVDHLASQEGLIPPESIPLRELKGRARLVVDELRRAGANILRAGYKKGTLSYPGMDSLENLDFLREEAAAVDLVAKRYAVLRLLEEVDWDQPEPEVPREFQVGEDMAEDRKVSNRDLGGVIGQLLDQAAEWAMAALKRDFLHRLGGLKERLKNFAGVQRDLDEGFEDLDKNAERRLKRLREQGDASANQYILDAEALQLETNRRRMWDFYFHDRVANRVEGLSLKDEGVQRVLSDTVTDLSISGTTRSQSGLLDKLLTSLRQHAKRILQPVIAGDPHSSDRHLREGLTLSDALELEVTYRALYENHAQAVEMEGARKVRSILAEFRAMPQEQQKEQIDLTSHQHQDYLRDKLKRVIKEKASLLCVYDESRDQHGGVRPDQVFLAAIDQDFRDSTIGEILARTDIANLQWVTEEWHNPKEIIFYRAMLNVPLYVFGRMDDMKNHYDRFRRLAKRSKVLHIDKNWEHELADLDPEESQRRHRQKLVGDQIINFATLLTTQRTKSWRDTCIVRKDGQYWLQEPFPPGGDDGSPPTDRQDGQVSLGASLTSAIETLPERLEEAKVQYVSYQQLLHGVREGRAPAVLRHVVRLPFLWRRRRDDLRTQYGSSPEPEQKRRLEDFTESFTLLQHSLEELRERLRTKEIEQRTLDESFLPAEDSDSTPDTVVREQLKQSIKILDGFSHAWRLMEDPSTAIALPSTFSELFKPLEQVELERVLHMIQTAFQIPAAQQPANDPEASEVGAKEAKASS